MVRTELTADDSLAAIRARNRFGMAMAAMIRMIATTISNSISEKPFCFRISCSPLLRFQVWSYRPAGCYFALHRPEAGAICLLGRAAETTLFSTANDGRRGSAMREA